MPDLCELTLKLSDVVGMDVVDASPLYDESTTLTAATTS